MNVLTYPPFRTRSMRIDGVLVTTCGIVATIVMTTVMYLLPLLGWAQVDLPTWIARIFTTAPVTVGETGVALHLLIGTMWAWVFAMQVEPRLSLTPAATGMVFGVSLWVFAQSIGVPIVGAIGDAVHDGGTTSPGWFALRLGLGPALSSLVAHVAYGVSLSVVYGRQGATSVDGRPTRVWTEQAPLQF
jgi:uncharacterized membrane protein YagU involved in acid resistance